MDGPSNQTNTHYEYEPFPQFEPEDEEAMQEQTYDLVTELGGKGSLAKQRKTIDRCQTVSSSI